MAGESLLEAYPLTWPDGQSRTPLSRRKQGRFEVTFGVSRDDLLAELERLGARNVIISTNIALRRDGLPRSDEREPDDSGVAVYFQRKAKPFVIACDTYGRVKHNLRAVGMTVAALRTIERHGSTQMMEQAFQGFAQLPAHAVEPSWWDVLGVHPDAALADIDAAHERLAQAHHPDVGGEHATMARINRARDIAREERGA